jgi:hypothetical protein
MGITKAEAVAQPMLKKRRKDKQITNWENPQKERRVELMPDWLWIPIFFVAYFALMRWALPRLGVPT